MVPNEGAAALAKTMASSISSENKAILQSPPRVNTKIEPQPSNFFFFLALTDFNLFIPQPFLILHSHMKKAAF